jgi:hypothetical protein
MIRRFRVTSNRTRYLRAASRPGEDRNKRSAFFVYNPLKRLDSDERIQGNPRESNPHNRGLSPRNGPLPRKPKRDPSSWAVEAACWYVEEIPAKRL